MMPGEICRNAIYNKFLEAIHNGDIEWDEEEKELVFHVDVRDILEEAESDILYSLRYSMTTSEEERQEAVMILNSLEFDDMLDLAEWLGYDEEDIISMVRE